MKRELACIAVMAMALAIGFANTVESQVGKNTGVLDPNLAGEKELLALPHLNPKLMKNILDKRPFPSMTALHALLSDSLGKEQLAELYAKLFIPVNLNTATEEEILLIPGVGKRIAHELEEYRPYRTLAQFRREIGKYVDEKELARLEQYVFVPINLNTASDADILSIPGVGRRLLHEFKEYRPYKSLEQFRREIGKYVDKNEIARLERYVTLE
jgi:DNA uptake protein ComE-like DNA-binding protein